MPERRLERAREHQLTGACPIQAALREAALDPLRARVPPATLLAVRTAQACEVLGYIWLESSCSWGWVPGHVGSVPTPGSDAWGCRILGACLAVRFQNIVISTHSATASAGTSHMAQLLTTTLVIDGVDVRGPRFASTAAARSSQVTGAHRTRPPRRRSLSRHHQQAQ